MSEARSPVHPNRPAGFQPMDFLALGRQSGGFSAQDFRSQADQRFQHARIEAMPDSRLDAPPRWKPDAALHAVAPALPASPASPPADTSAASVLDAEQAEQIRQAAYEEGRAQGLIEGRAQAEEQWRAQAESSQAQESRALHQLLERIGVAVQQLQQEPDTLHEPLKRLALHIAEELVLAELQIGAQAIDRLVQRCIDELQAGQSVDVCIELNPRDLALLQSQPDLESDRPRPWRWQANDQLLPGSVRVRVDDAMVTDLVEHRLQSLATAILGQPQRWSAQSALRSDSIGARFAQSSSVSDVEARPASDLTDAQPQFQDLNQDLPDE